jgi:hypothetical protein
VATNTDQLGESVKAVYGQGFDGRSYLRRFFDLEAALPPPDNRSFTRILLDRRNHFSERKILCWMSETKDPVHEISVVADALKLDLRDQERMHTMARAVIASLNSRYVIHVFWLYMLCAMRIKTPLCFDLATREGYGSQEAVDELRRLRIRFPSVQYRDGRSEHANDVFTAIAAYVRVSRMHPANIASQELLHHRSGDPFKIAMHALIEENSMSAIFPSTAHYPDLILQAGHLRV